MHMDMCVHRPQDMHMDMCAHWPQDICMHVNMCALTAGYVHTHGHVCALTAGDVHFPPAHGRVCTDGKRCALSSSALHTIFETESLVEPVACQFSYSLLSKPHRPSCLSACLPARPQHWDFRPTTLYLLFMWMLSSDAGPSRSTGWPLPSLLSWFQGMLSQKSYFIVSLSLSCLNYKN